MLTRLLPLYCLLVSFVCCCCSRTESKYVVKKTSQAPVIDGRADALWENTPSAAVSKIGSCTLCTTDSLDLSGRFKAVWDAEHLYFLFTIYDDIKFRNNLPANASEQQLWAAWKNDDIELFFDMNNDKESGFHPEEDDFRYDFIYDYDSVMTDGNARGISFAQTDFDKGYVLEVRIPWKNLKYAPGQDNAFGFEINVSDNDTKAPLEQGVVSWGRSKAAWAEEGGATAHLRTSVYGNLLLAVE